MTSTVGVCSFRYESRLHTVTDKMLLQRTLMFSRVSGLASDVHTSIVPNACDFE